MAKFLIGVGTGVLLVFLSLFLVFFALLRFRERPPEIAANSVLVLRLTGSLPEKTPVEIPFLTGLSAHPFVSRILPGNGRRPDLYKPGRPGVLEGAARRDDVL